MAKDHTYEKWLELGYQVKKGEKAAYKFYGNYIFTREQVVRIKSSEEYHSHCFRCRNDVDSDEEDQCPKCLWLICSHCEACGCDFDSE